MKPSKYFLMGFRGMLPITTGVIPFGAVVGTVCANAQLDFTQSILMNLFVYAGAAQLAVTELMAKHAASVVVVVTALIVNLRFLLYSAALAPYLKGSRFWVKFFCAYSLTDQSYAVMAAHQDQLKTKEDTLRFYFGGAACMYLAWQFSVIAGYVFGNFAPAAWSLDYAVPLSFVVLVIPALRSGKYLAVAGFSTAVSVLLYPLPYRIGLVLTALLAIGLGAIISKKRVVHD